MSVLVLGDIQNGKLNEATARTLTAAKALGEPVHVLVAGHNIGGAAATAARLEGVEKVLAVDDAIYAHQLAEPLAALILALSSGYSAILSASTSTAKNVMPRVAALLDVMQISEIIKVIAPDAFERPIYAGNAIQTVQSSEAKKIITVRTAAFAAAIEGAAPAPIEGVPAAAAPDLSSFKDEAVVKSERPELSSAKIIISGGRGMQNADNFDRLIQPIADRLGAAIGASRAAVDAGYAPNDWQVGQTGKIVAPDLYVAVGISGAIQHLAGMKDSKVIVAINKDGDAPIFEIADYGLVGDLFTILPALNDALAKLGR
jgi:electron transfer flavoprotein alpha subunit